MKATEILEKIKEALGIELSEEVTLAEMKLENGTVLEAEEFAEKQEVFIKTEDEKVPLPEGLYELEDGRTLVVIEEGLIDSIKSESETDMNEVNQVVAEEQEEKQEMGYATKEELNEVKSMIEEIKAMIEDKAEEPAEEMSEVEVEAEAVEAEEKAELKEELSKPAAEPMKHSPESDTQSKQHLYAQSRATTTFDRVLSKISNINQ
jgi:BMFP domain-containing protein YqiC